MKKTLLTATASVAIASGAFAQLTTAFDFGANYGGAGEPGWTNGANAGFGFGDWAFTNGGGGSSGGFIGDPSFAGIGGMSDESFGLYANPPGASAFVSVERTISSPLSVGQTFSFQWGINWDGGNSTFGNKGFNLFVGVTQVVNVNNGGNDDIQFNTASTGLAFGTNVMLWNFVYTNATTLFVSATGRDGSGSFSTNVTVGGGVDRFSIYASDMNTGDQRQPYYNDFQVVPEPSTYALLAMGAAAMGGYMIRRRRR